MAMRNIRSDWRVLFHLLSYLWLYRWRMIAALIFMIGAKVASVGVPILMKVLVDTMAPKPDVIKLEQAAVVVPVALLVAYGLLRFVAALFIELRELVFVKATEGTMRRISLEVFRHLHSLSLRFHLERQTGGLTSDIDRGKRALQSLISMSLFTILPTIIELGLVLIILGLKFGPNFVGVPVCALFLYAAFTVGVTEWRTKFRKLSNELHSKAQSSAMDALLNYETVKYFNNEEFETDRYDRNIQQFRDAALKSQRSLSLLTIGQQALISLSLIAMLWQATSGVSDGRMTLGDLVMVNAFMIQLYLPLAFLGIFYRETKQNITDLEKMFALLEKEREIKDVCGAMPLAGSDNSVRFDDVVFAYEAGRPILSQVSFEIPEGKTVAVVGPSGSGKSTLARLLFRFYDAQQGVISIGGADIREVQQASVRGAIGMVPQDTVLFNDTIEYNIAYGRPGATREQVVKVARAARIHDFIESMPKGYETTVGERGLKLSGGEKQRVAIARMLLKDPSIMIFDEATSALDSSNERAIQAELKSAAQGKTTLIIAHRLSTVVDVHEILVLEAGRIVERGNHADLLSRQGRYAQMWTMQQVETVSSSH